MILIWIKKLLKTYLKIINENNEIIILLNESQWEWFSIFGNLKMLIVIMNDFVCI